MLRGGPVLLAAMLFAAGAEAKTVAVAGLDSAAIAAAIAASQAGDTVSLPEGTYTITEPVTPKSGTRLVGAGQDKTIVRFAGEKPSPMVLLSGCEDTVVWGLTLDGASNPRATAGVFADHARRLSILYVTIRDLVKGEGGLGRHGIHLNGDPTREHGVTDSRIADCLIENIGVGDAFGCGIRMSWGSSRNRVEDCTVRTTGRGGIFGDNGSNDLIIRGNTVSGSGGEMLGIEVWGGCERCVIEDNHIDHWLSIGGCDWCATRRNTIGATDGTFGFIGIEAIGSHLVFTDNTVDDGQVIGLSVSSTQPKQYVYYGNNTFRRCSEWGAQFQGETGGIAYQYLYRCRFNDTTMGRGKVPYAGDDGNGFRTNGDTTHLVFEECEFANNARYGLQLGGGKVDALSFLRCAITGNKGAAVVGPGPYHPGPLGPYRALEWADCKVEGNGANDLPPAKPFARAAPVAALDAPKRATVGERVILVSKAKAAGGTIAKVLWDFGDGPPAEGERALWTYSKPGKYVVTMIAWDDSGRGARAEQTVAVAAQQG
jgi:PKD domain/Pectate lyase superfamily protein